MCIIWRSGNYLLLIMVTFIVGVLTLSIGYTTNKKNRKNHKVGNTEFFDIYCYNWTKSDYRSEQNLRFWSSSYSIQTAPAEVTMGGPYSARLQDDPSDLPSLHFSWWGDSTIVSAFVTFNIFKLQAAIHRK